MIKYYAGKVSTVISPFYLVLEKYQTTEIYKLSLKVAPYSISICEDISFVNQEYTNELFTEVFKNKKRLLLNLYEDLPDKIHSEIDSNIIEEIKANAEKGIEKLYYEATGSKDSEIISKAIENNNTISTKRKCQC